MQKAEINPQYRADIDGLRALAVLSVLVFHAFPQFFPSGFIGVDVFFVISGYLISGILFKSIDKDEFSFFNFYSRRIRRIFPALVVVLFTFLFLGWFTLLSGEYALLGKHTFWSTGFVQNLNLIQEAGYFDITSEMKPLLHLWSLSIEEQFYLIWPLIVALTYRRRRLFLSLVVLITWYSFSLNIKNISTHSTSTFFQIQTRVWELAAGSLLATAEVFMLQAPLLRLKNLIKSDWLSLLGLILFCSAVGVIQRDNHFPGWWALLPVSATIFFLCAQSGWFNRNILSNKLLVGIGLISYPLYLWHWPLLSFTRLITNEAIWQSQQGFALKGACLALSFLLAFLTYRFIERPARQLGHFVLPLVFLFVIVGIAGYIIYFNEGFSSRNAAFRIGFKQVYEEVPDSKIKLVKCEESLLFAGIENCRTSTHNTPPDVVVIGDSHSLSFASGLNHYYQAKGRRLHVFETGDTIGLIDTGTIMGGDFSFNESYRTLNTAFNWAIEKGARTVVLISRGPMYFEGHEFGDNKRQLNILDLTAPSNIDNKKTYLGGLERTLKALLSANIEVVYFYDNPEMGFAPDEMCFQRPFTIIDPILIAPCAVSLEKFNQRQRDYRLSVGAVLQKYPQVKVFDPAKYLCDSEFCHAIRENRILYGDSNHLSSYGGLWISKYYNF